MNTNAAPSVVPRRTLRDIKPNFLDELAMVHIHLINIVYYIRDLFTKSLV
jgi:hypothetical protein